MGTRQSGDSFSFLYSGDARLIEEVSEAVKNLRKDPAQAEILEKLNRYAMDFFSDSGHMIALN